MYNDDEGAKQRDPASGYNKESETAAQPGDRAPEASGLVDSAHAATLSLFGIFAPSVHTVLVFAGGNGSGNGNSDTLHALPGIIARQPEGAVRAVLIVSPKSKSESRGAGLFEQVLVDRDGHAHAGYNVPVVSGEKVTLVVVRPDGFIGARVHNATGIERYFGCIFASGSK